MIAKCALMEMMVDLSELIAGRRYKWIDHIVRGSLRSLSDTKFIFILIFFFVLVLVHIYYEEDQNRLHISAGFCYWSPPGDIVWKFKKKNGYARADGTLDPPNGSPLRQPSDDDRSNHRLPPQKL
ncbi:hypothetical protein PGB90_003595 [Kerria lacca]